MENKSGLRPLGRAILLDPLESLPEFKATKIVIPDTVKDRVSLAEQQAIVVAVGPEAWKDEKEPRAKPGDRVMVSKYAGTFVPGKDGKTYRAVNSNDVFLGID